MPRQFSFGSDPEFIFVGQFSNGSFDQIDAYEGSVGGITNHSGLGQIGRNGCSSTAEIRTHAHPTLEALEAEILEIINMGARQLQALRPQSMDPRYVRLGMMFGANVGPNHTATGGHLHITTNDLTWYYTKEAVQVLPFFCTLATFLYDRDHARRGGRGGYGHHGDMHPSPDGRGSRQRVPGTTIDVQVWPDGTKGWELRTPSAWIAPQSGAFRQKLFKCVKAVIYSDEDEKEKQFRFLSKVCENLGGTIWKEINTTTRARYDQYYEQVKRGEVAYTGGEHRWLNEYFCTRPDSNENVNFGKLLTACLNAQNEVHLTGLDDIFADMDPTHPYHNDLNPQVVWPPPAAPIPIREVKFPSMAAAITAVKESYAAFVASTHKADWISNGKAWFKIFPVKYVIENNIARDQYVPDITHIAFGLCVDVVQRRALHVKFLPRRTESAHIYGGGEERSFNGRPADVVFLGPQEFVENADVRTLMATESLTTTRGDNNLFLRMNFRQSSSDLRYIAVALYILWMQNYIRGIGEEGQRVEKVAGVEDTFKRARNSSVLTGEVKV